MSHEQQGRKLQLIVEKSDGELWGRVRIKGNLIVDSANSIQSLEKQLKKLIYDFENVEVEIFDIAYDLSSFFESHTYLNISDVAKRSGINQTLMRQYASGLKFPSEDRVKQIEGSIREIGKELTRIKLHKPQREYTKRSVYGEFLNDSTHPPGARP